MKKELEENLLEYLGELKYAYENSFDHFAQLFIGKKINCVEHLLGMRETDYSISTKESFSEAWDKIEKNHLK